ncbi:MAG: T9SS type A sorting domain-containing protein, partial [Ferruginibacter sp.]
PFITKFNSDGSWLWSRHIHTLGFSSGGRIISLSTDYEGNIYFAGSFYGTLIYGNDTIASIGYSDNFWGKTNPEGNVLWMKAAGSDKVERETHIVADSAGNCYVTGFLGTNSTVNSYFDQVSDFTPYGFVAKYSNEGELKWLQTDATGYFSGLAIALNANETELAITGSLLEQALTTIGNVSLFVSNNDDVTFAAKLDTSGEVIWIKQLAESAIKSFGVDIVFTPDNNLMVAGYCPASLIAIIETDTLYFEQDANSPSLFISVNSNSGEITNYCYLPASNVKGLTTIDDKVHATGIYRNYTNGPQTIFLTDLSYLVNNVKDVDNKYDFMVYPNPGYTELNFRSDHPGPVHLSIRNAQGTIVYESDFEKSTFTINCEIKQLNPGVYFLELTDQINSHASIRKWLKLE